MSGLFSSPDFSMPEMPDQPTYEPMTFEQHQLLLDREAELAELRDESQRQFVLEQEQMRMQQEEAQREMLQREEESVQREIAQQEQEAASAVTMGTVDEIQSDVDDVVSNMYEALLGGVAADDSEEAGGEPIPE